MLYWNVLALFFEYIRDYFKYVLCAPSTKVCRIRKHKMTISVKRETKIFAISPANFLHTHDQNYQLSDIMCRYFDNVSLFPKLFSSRRNSTIRRRDLSIYSISCEKLFTYWNSERLFQELGMYVQFYVYYFLHLILHIMKIFLYIYYWKFI